MSNYNDNPDLEAACKAKDRVKDGNKRKRNAERFDGSTSRPCQQNAKKLYYDKNKYDQIAKQGQVKRALKVAKREAGLTRTSKT